MQISQMFRRKPCVFSIECFPPEADHTLCPNAGKPACNAGPAPRFYQRDLRAPAARRAASPPSEVARFLKQELGVEPLAHILCMGSDKSSAKALLDELETAGVTNVLTLRGDRTPLRPESPDFVHACDLASLCLAAEAGV